MARLPRKLRPVAIALAVVASAAVFGGGATLVATGASGSTTGGKASAPDDVKQQPSGSAAVGTAPVNSTPGDPSSLPLEGDPASTTTLAPLGTNVAVVGDSLTLGIEDQLRAEAKQFGFTTKMDAVQGRDIDGSMSAIKRLAPGRDLVVLALGTNDARKGLTTADATSRIDEALNAVGEDVPVLWVNVYRGDSKSSSAAADVFDRALALEAFNHPNLTVVDWDSFIKDHVGLVGADHIHLTSAGYDVRAAWLADAIANRLHLPPPALPDDVSAR
jgi:lysophospholipase L1-like esterase